MNTIDFKVTFLSDIILQASSNTEGKVTNLDFIPGSNFLGMVARAYEEFENPFDIFHSGKVRFGDATLMHENQRTYKVPFSFFKPKYGGDVKNHHLIETFEADEQLKQIRSGYITKSGDVVEPKYNYSQKSAYDTDARKSKESHMFGYSAMNQGTVWRFSVQYDDAVEIDKVIEKLSGKKQLGKSKSSQYGSVHIEQVEIKNENVEDVHTLENVVLYANSRWALFDEHGMPTLQPTSKNLGLSENIEILWDKCQLRTSSFTPYNRARKTKDYTRLVIEKGSVIVLKKLTSEDIQVLKSGVGGYLSEGFGEVLINPIFTQSPKPRYKEKELSIVAKHNGKIDTTLISFLEQKEKKENDIFDVSTSVEAFIKEHKSKFSEVSKSQWGQIRSICGQSDTTDANIKQKVQEFIDHGVAKKRWKKGEQVLLSTIDSIKFTQLLATLMPKQKGDNND